MIDMIKESVGFKLNSNTTEVKCKAFEDNNGSLDIAPIQKLRRRTKHINVKFHYFRSAVMQGNITITKIATEDQLADIFTKPLAVTLFVKLRRLIMGW
jgi:uncharacterized protein YeaO (DUF488 family)